MLIERVAEILTSVAPLRRVLWQSWYQYLACHSNSDLWFMNYGFVPCHPHQCNPPLTKLEEKYRTNIQLYHFAVSRVPIENCVVVEVGSGRGGGAYYIKRRLEARSVIGIDVSRRAVGISNAVHSASGLMFFEGDAENLPIEPRCVDVVVAIECTHCFGSLDRFLSEASRVLKPGGHVLLADLRATKRIPDLIHAFARARLNLVEMLDISRNVSQAMRLQSDERSAVVRAVLPRLLWKAGDAFAGVSGSAVLSDLENGTRQYFTAVLKKPPDDLSSRSAKGDSTSWRAQGGSDPQL